MKKKRAAGNMVLSHSLLFYFNGSDDCFAVGKIGADPDK
jgi:hypothetical protein